ncbi:MAG: CRISPR-associated protein Cas4 [Chloroflexaceae bacterium]
MSLDIGPPAYIPLSMLNSLAYCPRRFAYEFIQAEMLLNEHVVEGHLWHEGVDLGGTTWLDGAVQRRRVYVWSERLRIAGFCDIVEARGDERYPVEFKKGRPGRWNNDHIQLCAQAMCLEERTGARIERGFIFYATVRRREEVACTTDLRAAVERAAAEAHRLAAAGTLPPPIEQRARCRHCSLEPLCLPDELRQLAGTVAD